MRSYKKPLIVLLAVFLLPVLLSGAFLVFIWLDKDHQQLKTQLQAWFKQQTQHELRIAGPMEIGFYPSFHVSAGQVSIIGHAQHKLLELENMLVEVDPLSVFESPQIKKIVIERARLKFVKTETGDIIFFQQKPDPDRPQNKGSTTFLPFGDIEVIDSEIHLLDTKNRKLAKLINVNASLASANRKQSTVSLKADFYALSDKPVDISLTGDIQFAGNHDGFETENIQLLSKATSLKSIVKIKKHKQETQVLWSVLEFEPVMLFEHLGMTSQLNQKSIFNQVEGKVEIHQLEDETNITLEPLTIDDTRIQGRIDVSDEIVKLNVTMDELNLEPYLEFFSNFITEDETKETTAELISSIHINRLKLLHGEVEQFSNHLHLKDESLLETGGSLKIKKVNPGILHDRYTTLLKIHDVSGLVLDKEILNYLDGMMSYSYVNNELTLKDMALKLDDTTINGFISIKFPFDEVNAGLSIGRLDLERYYALLPAGDADTANAANTDVNLEELLHKLERIKGKGDISIETMNYQGTSYNGINIQFNE